MVLCLHCPVSNVHPPMMDNGTIPLLAFHSNKKQQSKSSASKTSIPLEGYIKTRNSGDSKKYV